MFKVGDAYYLCPGYPSEYLLFRQEPCASKAARLQKFWRDKQKSIKTCSKFLSYLYFQKSVTKYNLFFFKPDIAFIYLQKDDCFANTYCNKNGADAFNSLLYKLQMSHIWLFKEIRVH